MQMKIRGSIALVTGANRGLGLAFVRALQAAGAHKIYAAARRPEQLEGVPGIVPVRLDVTRADDVAQAVRSCADVDLVINNAGIFAAGSLLAADGAQALRDQLDTNLLGTLAVSTAFAPVLRANGGGALVNVLSALSWAVLPGTASYSASKAAGWALTNGLRGELRPQGTLVVGVHAAFIDTDMAKNVQAPKIRPEDVVAQVLAAVEEGREEVLADETTRSVKRELAAVASH
jgi:NAD(P)-dependent dehydrogenase (short-subunit alcohol dehydrogenase family)